MREQIMKLLNQFKLILVTSILTLSGCGVEVEGLDDIGSQMLVIKRACEKEGIRTKTELEDLLNSGGNGISKACKTSIGQVNLSALKLKVDLGFEAKNPLILA